MLSFPTALFLIQFYLFWTDLIKNIKYESIKAYRTDFNWGE